MSSSAALDRSGSCAARPAHAGPGQPALADALGAAASAVAAVLSGRTPEAPLQAVAARLRPAATDLAFSALRAYGRGDAVLRPLLERPLKDANAHALLLVALARLEARPDEAHTIVDQAVEAAGRIGHGQFRGLVNGVLRSFERRRDALLDSLNRQPAARWQHPAWWIERLQQDHPDHWEAILAAGNRRPPMALRVNRRRIAAVDFAARLQAAGVATHAAGEDGLMLERPVPVDRLPGFADGDCSVQDPGAQAACVLLDAADGMRVLDACAAPGGKTAHLLEHHALDLLALDADAERLDRVASNLARLGLAATLRAEDCRDTAKWWDGRPFDRILADVPCSASGVVRRHPDAKWLRRAGDIAGFARTQQDILEALWPLLAPGGRLLYATCSVFRQENRGQIDAFLARHAEARCVAEQSLLPAPDHDGFYYAALVRA